MRKRSRSIVKGAIAGLLGGIVATAAKSAAEKIYPPHAYGAPGSELPSIPSDDRDKHSLVIRQKRDAPETAHWGFGAAAGAAYGALAEFYPPATSKQGASFGMALVAMTHDHTLPILGRAAKPTFQTKRERSSELASYVVYGIVTETVRSIVRRMIA